ncbi:MAG: phosphodiesterase [Coxiellaceae bacterium]|jgi:Icc protein|nr:phosphodiesterase [Coxiellaceae bacterium]
MTQITKILHITDLHLFNDRQKKLVGINPFQTFSRVITKISNDIKQSSPNLIILTGDISQDYSVQAYKTAKDLLQQFQCPITATMGNHDYLPAFTKIFDNPTQLLSLTDWRIILLNSHWTNHVDGQLTSNELTFLKQSLSTSYDQPVIIFLHHQVLSIESHWIDTLKLQNHVQFLKIIDQYNNIKAVVCGHVHQDTTSQRQNVLFLSTPATNWQFTVKSHYFKLDTLMPGYRWINLYSDGTIQTEVVRIEHNDEFIPDANIKRY